MDVVKQLTEKDEINAAEDGFRSIEIRRGELAQPVFYQGYTEMGLSIAAVQEYLAKSDATDDEIKNSYATYSYERLFLALRFADRSGTAARTHGDNIGGVLNLHPELEAWQINNGKQYSAQSLSDFIKMNRHYFESKETAMVLVSALRNLKVKADKEIEHTDNRQGDYRIVAAQKVIESNIPAEFVLKLPVFVGTDPVSVKVEVEISAFDFSCTLISPDLKQIIDQETKVIIDEQLNAIRALYPQLRIFQK